MSVTPDPLEGTLLDGRYRVEAMIATGGMSTVYRGLDLRLDRPVALKVMDSRYATDAQFLARFQLEARAVASLKDAGLVAVYDQGMDATRPFLVMELIEGGTLRELLRERGPMPPYATAAVLRPVLGGLAVAHQAGLVHRDIKPENVLISDDGEVKLVDFGLVRAFAEAGITSTSVILGTAAYLSPEQVSSGSSSPPSDVYSVGILAYELLTGVTPFTGDNPLTVAYQRIDHDVPVASSVISGVPPQFDEFIGRATSRNIDDRFADAAEMGAELDAIAEELELPPFRVPAPRNSAQHSAQTTAAQTTAAQTNMATRTVAHPQPVTHPTRHLTRGPEDWQPADRGQTDWGQTDWGPPEQPGSQVDRELPNTASQFAGIDINEFILARQRARRTTTFWLLIVLILTGLTAAAAWMAGTNIQALLAQGM